ncbi:hypothetical protein GE09DRAFT_1084405 [Coniochaeta sp. 2T2.1]|nr:hypothetical protein GE09DRAFT_1084405 [Coniochaeta sp. 2T2.1]
MTLHGWAWLWMKILLAHVFLQWRYLACSYSSSVCFASGFVDGVPSCELGCQGRGRHCTFTAFLRVGYGDEG